MTPRAKFLLLTTGVLLIGISAFGQTVHSELPCAFDGPLLRDSHGDIVHYTSDEMKQRAIAKEDLTGFIKKMDFRSVMLLRVLVSSSGNVVCVKMISGIPIARRPSEEAVLHWKFRVAKTSGKPVAYVGWLEFNLCNIGCGDEGPSMTLLR